ncbi:alpha/beta fold hydrolase [Polynucleobacter kasalickyi]|uniref:Magnesium chelatase accessory protein n=1 Tax=Polynucleobacter kasalickyi TaxID=1938817 RepID=A0A1W1Y328_9BURK|nr:alpha/beta fold hydrolase [Polynucleobacter kasalickyi]SMC30524.1 magnesium chelatase accessory protein [Polynucleobacter kasalickyi]
MLNANLSKIPKDWPNLSLSTSILVNQIQWHVQIHRHPNPEARTILLIHGAGASTHSWENILPNLMQEFTVIAPDLPGHGFTTGYDQNLLKVDDIAFDLHLLLEELGFPHPDILIGHSAGTNICLALSVLCEVPPQLIIGMNPALVPPPSAYNMFLGPLIHPIATSSIMAHFLASTLRLSGSIDKILDSTNSALTPLQRSRYKFLFNDSNHINSALSFVAAINIPKLLKQSKEVNSQLAFVLTKQDSWIQLNSVRAVIKEYYPQAILFEEEGGHLFHEANPLRALEIIHTTIQNVHFDIKVSV